MIHIYFICIIVYHCVSINLPYKFQPSLEITYNCFLICLAHTQPARRRPISGFLKMGGDPKMVGLERNYQWTWNRVPPHFRKPAYVHVTRTCCLGQHMYIYIYKYIHAESFWEEHCFLWNKAAVSEYSRTSSTYQSTCSFPKRIWVCELLGYCGQSKCNVYPANDSFTNTPERLMWGFVQPKYGFNYPEPWNMVVEKYARIWFSQQHLAILLDLEVS